MTQKVLLLSDTADLPRITSQMLHLSGIKMSIYDYRITWIDDIATILNQFDLVLVDISRDYSELVRCCTDLRLITENPILVMAPHQDETLLLRLFDAGADDCLVEPISHRLFVAIVQAWLRRLRLLHSSRG